MVASDLPTVLRIQASSYPSHLHEAVQTYEQRLRAYPEGSLVIEDGGSGAVFGYGMSHPWLRAHAPPQLGDGNSLADGVMAAVANREAAYYHMHDVAVVRGLHSRGAGRLLFWKLLQHASDAQWQHAGLVAVLGMERLWSASGFAVAPMDRSGLDGYSVDGEPAAVWMEAAIAAALPVAQSAARRASEHNEALRDF